MQHYACQVEVAPREVPMIVHIVYWTELPQLGTHTTATAYPII